MLLLLLNGTADASTILRVGTLTELEPLSPVVTHGFWYGTGYAAYLHMPLITYRAPDARFGPCLAREWVISTDNRSITFELHAGVRWHDGEPVTAADVAFTLNYVKEHELIGQLWRFLESAEAIDTGTALVTFTEPVAFYQSMFFPWPKILPRHIWEAVEEPGVFQGREAMIGSGPFTFERFDVDARIAHLRKTPGYFDGPVHIEGLQIRYYGTIDALLLALKRGDIDVVMGPGSDIPLSYLPALEHDAHVELMEIPDSGVPLTMVFHARNYPVRIRDFRRALSHAVDSAGLISGIYRGRGQVPELGFVPPAAWTYAGPTAPLRHDAQLAMAILDSLGFRDIDGDGIREDTEGRPFKLQIIPETWEDRGDAIRAVELVAFQLGGVGIRVEMDKHVLDEELELLWERRDYMLYIGHATPASVRDGGHVYFANYRDFSYGTFEDSTYFDILHRISHAPDRRTYLNAVGEAQHYNASEIPGLALVWGSKMFAYRQDRVTGWQPMLAYGIPNYDSWFALRPGSGHADGAADAARHWRWPAAGAALVLALGGAALHSRRRRRHPS